MAEAIHLTHGRAARTRPQAGWFVVVLAVAAAAAYAWLRLPTGTEIHAGMQHFCATLEMQPQDWICRVSAMHGELAFASGSLLFALALAMPCVVLIAAGRHLTGFVPLLVPLAAIAGVRLLTWALAESHGVEQPFLGIYGPAFAYGSRPETYWELHRGITIAIDTALIALPLVAFALVRARHRPGSSDAQLVPMPSARGRLIAGVACAVAIWAAINLAGKTLLGMDATLLPQPEDLWLPIAVIASFGALLGPDRRWWPWVLAPVAFLLSGALTDTILGTIWKWDSFWRWGPTITLFGAGLIASGWRPLALRIDRARGVGTKVATLDAETAAPEAGSTRRVRPAAVANALAAGLLITCLIAARFDPLPFEISIALPTYLGARDAVADLRARHRLDDAFAATEAFAAAHGGIAGFDAAAGARTDASLRWVDGLPGGAADERPSLRTVSVLAAPEGVRLVALSYSGHGVCVQTQLNGGATYGLSAVRGAWTRVMADAVTHCSDRAFDGAALRAFPIASLCDDVGDGSILICRGVQRLLRDKQAGVTG
jgi:hypothetical protein